MFGLLILNILCLWPAASASPEDRGLIVLWVFIFLFIPNTILVGLALRINGISRESGLRRILIEQVAAEQRRRSIQSVAISTLPAIGMVSPILVQKQILILNKLGLVASGQGFVSLTTLGWARVERKEKTVKLTENFTMNDMSNTFNNSPIGNASFVVNSENVSVQQTQGSAHVDLNQLAEQLGALRQALLQDGNLTAEKTIDVGKVAQAEQLAKQGDGNGAKEVLKSVGKWALDAAEKISLDLVLRFLGLPI